MSIVKSCADYLRERHASQWQAKLRAGHAHEIVAAAFGYRTAAAMQTDQMSPPEGCLTADFVFFREDDIAARLGNLSDLPDGLLAPADLALEIANHLRLDLGATGDIRVLREGAADADDILIKEQPWECLSFRSLERLAPDPIPLGEDSSFRVGGIFGPPQLPDLRKEVSQDGIALTVTSTFEGWTKALERPQGAQAEQPWYKVMTQFDRCAGRAGWRITSSELRTERGDVLDLVANPPAANMTNPFHATLDQEKARLSRMVGRWWERDLPAGTLLTLTYEEPAPRWLLDGRPHPGEAIAGQRERESGVTLIPPRPWATKEIFMNKGSVEWPSLAVRLPETMPWVDAIWFMNQARRRNSPVNTDIRMLFLELVEPDLDRPGGYILQCGT
jgi:hypothetical protein